MEKDNFLEKLPLGGKIKPGRPPTTPAEEYYEYLSSPEGEAEFRARMHKAAEEYKEKEEREGADINIEAKELDTVAESHRDKLEITLKILKSFVGKGKLKPNSPFYEVFETLHLRDKELRRLMALHLTKESRQGGVLRSLGEKKPEEAMTPELMEERHDLAYAILVLLKLWEEEPGELDKGLPLGELEELLEAKIAEIGRVLEAKRGEGKRRRI